MATRFTYTDERADLTFTWDGWRQIHIRPGRSVPPWAYADRFDIREPDLRDGSVHFVPQTQEGFEETCRRWLDGADVRAGLRDFTADPWHARGHGLTGGAFEMRYTGGDVIEARPADTGDYRPVIDLAHDGKRPADVSSHWLHGRTHGWSDGWITGHGITPTGSDLDLDDARIRFAQSLPSQRPHDSLVGRWHRWCEATAREEFSGDGWMGHRNAGAYVRHPSSRPWHHRTTGPDGTRWNFAWNGGPYAHVYSPDRRPEGEPKDRHKLVLRPEHEAGGLDVYGWLTAYAELWTIGDAPPA